MKDIHTIVLISVILSIALISATDYQIRSGGSQIFTVASNATVQTTNLALSGWLNVTGDVQAANFYGDGSGLTGITVGTNATVIAYQNVTGWPTCDNEQHLRFDGTTLTCNSTAVNSTVIAYQNVTGWPTCADGQRLYYDGSALSCAAPTVNATVIAYQNVTGIPTCGAGESLTFDGTTLTCSSTAWDNSNVAYLNNTQTFTAEQTFDEDIHIVKNINMTTNDSAVMGRFAGTNITFDSSGNIIINLG